MAAGAWTTSGKAKLNFVNATDLLNATATNFRVALVTSTWTPDTTNTELWGDTGLSTNEIANGNGYTTGGIAATSGSVTASGTTVTFTIALPSPTWTASGTGIPAWRYAVLYYLGTLNAKVNPVAGWCLGDSTPADVPLTTSGNTLTITISGSGVFTMS